jgi:hypothetical protein
VRRWIEINVTGGFIKGGSPVVVTGKETTWDPRTHTRREANPHFISMPTKPQLVAFFQGMTGQGIAENQTLMAFVGLGGSTDVPAADCTAEHLYPIGTGYRILSVGPYLQTIFFNGYAPNFNTPLFDESTEPPSVNG